MLKWTITFDNPTMPNFINSIIVDFKLQFFDQSILTLSITKKRGLPFT